MFKQTILSDSDVVDLIRVRRAVHAQPELSHQEVETREFVMAELAAAGLGVVERVGSTGFAIDVFGRAPGKGRRVGLRADMDALPIQETAEVPFASQRPGVMHACGHDAHTAMVLAAGLWLERHADTFSGQVRLFFQHSEEALPSGAAEFVDAGLADSMDAVFGIHVDPTIPVGMVAVQPGPFACSSDHFDLVVHGTSSHGGRPHEGRDAIGASASLLQELNRIRSHETDPMVPLVITVGQISGGTAHNVIADRVVVRGTIRCGDNDVRSLAHMRVREISRAVSESHRVSIDVAIVEDGPLLINDPDVASMVATAAMKVAGTHEILSNAPMWSASDDFAYFSNAVPGAYFRIGVRNEARGFVHPLHHPEFAIDESALPIGAAVLVQSVLDALDALDA